VDDVIRVFFLCSETKTWRGKFVSSKGVNAKKRCGLLESNMQNVMNIKNIRKYLLKLDVNEKVVKRAVHSMTIQNRK
jgi:hypothetical protein